MRILLASSSPIIDHTINSVSNDIVIDAVETGEEVFQLLEKNSYHCLISEATLVDIDIWSIAQYINIKINAKPDQYLPLFVIKERNINPSRLLYSNYGIKTIALSEIDNVANLIINNNTKDKPSILIIEDDKHVANGMRITLQKEYEVNVSHSGKEGIDCWKEKKHDLILLDLMMPVVSGKDVFRTIRSIKPDQPIIIESAISESDIQKEMILLGANGYLTKPFNPQELNRTCRIVLTQVLHQHIVDKKDEKMEFIVNNLWLALDALENEDLIAVKDIISKIIHSMPDGLKSDDSRLIEAINR
jgi:DNA-binding response OmpR family regulator